MREFESLLNRWKPVPVVFISVSPDEDDLRAEAEEYLREMARELHEDATPDKVRDHVDAIYARGGEVMLLRRASPDGTRTPLGVVTCHPAFSDSFWLDEDRGMVFFIRDLYLKSVRSRKKVLAQVIRMLVRMARDAGYPAIAWRSRERDIYNRFASRYSVYQLEV